MQSGEAHPAAGAGSVCSPTAWACCGGFGSHCLHRRPLSWWSRDTPSGFKEKDHDEDLSKKKSPLRAGMIGDMRIGS